MYWVKGNLVSLSSLYLTIHTTIDAIVISNSLLPIDVNNVIHTIHTTDVVNNTIVNTIVNTTIVVNTIVVNNTIVNTIVVIVWASSYCLRQ